MLKIAAYLSEGTARTLLMPLCCCGTASRLNPEGGIYDARAAEVLRQVDYDFTRLRRAGIEYTMLCCLLREWHLDKLVRAFVAGHPEGTIVNLGCGLSTAAFRQQLGACRWYDLDVPEVIRVRQMLLPPEEGQQLVACSLLDPAWMEAVTFVPEAGALFLAAGGFYYFSEAQLRPLMLGMARHFPGGRLWFDAVSRRGLKIANLFVRLAGFRRASMRFAVDDPAELARWSPLLRVQGSSYYADAPRQRLGLVTRLHVDIGERLGMVKNMAVDFAGRQGISAPAV